MYPTIMIGLVRIVFPVFPDLIHDGNVLADCIEVAPAPRTAVVAGPGAPECEVPTTSVAMLLSRVTPVTFHGAVRPRMRA